MGDSFFRPSHDLWGTPTPSVPRLVGDTSTVILRDRVGTRAGLSSAAYCGELVRRGRSSTGVLPQVRLESMARVRSSGEVWRDGSVAIAVQLVGSVFWVSPASRSSRHLLGPCGFLSVFYSWLQFLVAVPLPLVEARGLLACSWALGVPFFLLSSFPSLSLVRFFLPPPPRYPISCSVSFTFSPFLLHAAVFSPCPFSGGLDR